MDIKLENILITPDCKVFLIDFGLCQTNVTKLSLQDTFIGSLSYSSPEMINHVPYNGFQVDAWSLGIVMYSLLHASLPFKEGGSSDHVEFSYNINEGAKNLICKLLEVDPTSRLDVHDACKDKWTEGKL
jgi:serine/threonine protein kinase